MFMEFINLKVEVSVWLILKDIAKMGSFSYDCFESVE